MRNNRTNIISENFENRHEISWISFSENIYSSVSARLAKSLNSVTNSDVAWRLTVYCGSSKWGIYELEENQIQPRQNIYISICTSTPPSVSATSEFVTEFRDSALNLFVLPCYPGAGMRWTLLSIEKKEKKKNLGEIITPPPFF